MDKYERRAERYQATVSQAQELFLRKNKEYGDAIAETGVLGSIVELVGIAGRLRNVVLQRARYFYDPVEDLNYAPVEFLSKETVKGILRDKFQDALNYSVIGLMMLEDENWTGNPPEFLERKEV